MKKFFSRHFPTPVYLNMDACAFDISDESVKYGQLENTPHGLKLVKLGKEKIPEGVIVSGKIIDQKKIINILKNIKTKEKFNFARVSLPEEQMYVFTLSLPQMKGQDLREMIYLQIEENIPLKAVEIVFDYDIIFQDEKSVVVEVSAVSEEIIQVYLSIFKQAGLTPVSFEIEAQAITRAVVPKDEKSTVMIVDFGYNRTGVSVSHNRNVLFTTTLDIGGLSLTKMLAKNFSLTFDKAEELKKSYGITADAKDNDIFPVIINGISVLHDELNKQYTYWKNHNENNGLAHEKIERIILCGGNANLAGLAEYLEASMKIKVEYANAWVNISDLKTNVPEVSFEDSLSYVTVLGLALGSFFDASDSVINVLPIEEKKSIRREYWVRLMTISFHLISFIGVLAVLLLIPSYFLSVSKESLAEEKLEEFNRLNPEISTLNIDNTINDINAKLTFLTKNDLNPEITEKVFGWVLKNKPQGITFSQMLFSKRTDGSLALELHGVAGDRVALRDFKTILDSNPDYKEVNLPISNFLEKSDLIFTISIIIK
jgi:type IV pilus assembly protein PilM